MTVEKNIYYLFINYCLNLVPKYILLISLEKTEIMLLAQYNNIYNLIYFFKKHTNTLLNVLSDICAVDYPQKKLRFETIYNCFSTKYNYKLRFKISLNEVMAISSIHSIFLSSDWWERELWDMFGIFFFNHSRLRRILTDYGFNGYPLRKDFPCIGFYEVRYSENLQKIVYEPIEFSCYMRFN
jgi:NADH dehydrogenase (ubiquinone) Fe-S protein 3